jgi:hypothetical protein
MEMLTPQSRALPFGKQVCDNRPDTDGDDNNTGRDCYQPLF